MGRTKTISARPSLPPSPIELHRTCCAGATQHDNTGYKGTHGTTEHRVQGKTGYIGNTGYKETQGTREHRVQGDTGYRGKHRVQGNTGTRGTQYEGTHGTKEHRIHRGLSGLSRWPSVKYGRCRDFHAGLT